MSRAIDTCEHDGLCDVLVLGFNSHHTVSNDLIVRFTHTVQVCMRFNCLASVLKTWDHSSWHWSFEVFGLEPDLVIIPFP